MKSTQKHIVLSLFSVLLTGCGMGMDDHMGAANGPRQTFSSLGEQIYFTGIGADGRAIPFSGGNMHYSMHGGGCAGCHGQEREGGDIMYPYFWVRSAPLTNEALFSDHEDGHGDHDVYSSQSLAEAIRNGVDPDGEPLHSAMPRWNMSERDLKALIRYLTEQIKNDSLSWNGASFANKREVFLL
ncbi:c-type cytochrome [Aestuariirhabdus sp. LZHN29]|uniref:c-type cytochrome n=1 Tax=Aestuariirhabdus sp. LZHN29 TaxID=3417462 RepID=UPI003CF37078